MDSMFQSLLMRLRSTRWGNSTSGNNTDSCAPNPRGHLEPELYILYLKQKNPFLPVLTHTFITKSDMKKRTRQFVCKRDGQRWNEGKSCRNAVFGFLLTEGGTFRSIYRARTQLEKLYRNTYPVSAVYSSSSSSSQLKHSLIIIFKLF